MYKIFISNASGEYLGEAKYIYIHVYIYTYDYMFYIMHIYIYIYIYICNMYKCIDRQTVLIFAAATWLLAKDFKV